MVMVVLAAGTLAGTLAVPQCTKQLAPPAVLVVKFLFVHLATSQSIVMIVLREMMILVADLLVVVTTVVPHFVTVEIAEIDRCLK